jgi:drug/metabolite transporter (DMT)-like permease
LEPIVAAAAGFALLGVALSPLQYVGGALIVVAVALLGANTHARPHSPAQGRPP